MATVTLMLTNVPAALVEWCTGSESVVEESVGIHAYQCTCVAGLPMVFANTTGMCDRGLQPLVL